MLLVKKVEASVCIFEKENRLGGDIYDHFFSQASDISVGQFSLKKKAKICMCVSVVAKMSFCSVAIFYTFKKQQGRLQ